MIAGLIGIDQKSLQIAFRDLFGFNHEDEHLAVVKKEHFAASDEARSDTPDTPSSNAYAVFSQL